MGGLVSRTTGTEPDVVAKDTLSRAHILREYMKGFQRGRRDREVKTTLEDWFGSLEGGQILSELQGLKRSSGPLPLLGSEQEDNDGRPSAGKR